MTGMAQESLHRRLAAIVMADVVGYSRLMEADEVGTLRALKQHRHGIIDPEIAAHNGRLVKLMGDGILVEFASVFDAMNCAIAIQRRTAESNRERVQEPRIELRIGVHLGDVIVERDDIYGDGVNVAARLQGLAEPGGICLSGSVYDAAENKLSMRCEFLGDQRVKNLSKPVRSYRVCGGDASPGLPPARRAASPRAKLKPSSEPTLAVKPLEPIGGDPDCDGFANSLTNGVLAALNRMIGLTLIQDESPSFQHSTRMSPEELAERFEVRFLLKGQVHKLGARIRVNAELLEVSNGRLLWADMLDRNLGDLGDFFEIQDDITEEIVTALDIKLVSGEGARITRKVLKNPAAQQCLYRGEYLLWNATNKLELYEAQRLLEEIIHLEPQASIGYAEAALAHWVASLYGLSDDPANSLERAVELARQAIALDDVTGYPHLILALSYLHDRQFDDAKAEADQAVSARPSCPAAFAIKAHVLTYLGDAEDAIEHAKHAFRLSPVHPQIFPAVLASAYYGAARYEEAMMTAQEAIAVAADKAEPHLIVAACAVALGQAGEALQAADKVRALKPEFSLAAFAASEPYRDQGHLERMVKQLEAAGLE